MPEPAAEQAAFQAPDPAFGDSERLFRRIHPDHLLDGFLADAFLPFPSFSVNREKYSRPEDVICDHPAFGIAAFAVGDIPPELENESSQTFQFGVEHAPLPDNYAHSEVHSYLDGRKAKPSRIVRKRFRDLLRQRTVILKRPAAA